MLLHLSIMSPFFQEYFVGNSITFFHVSLNSFHEEISGLRAEAIAFTGAI